MAEHQRLKGEFENEDETKAEVEAHIARLKDIYEYSLWRFPPKNEDEDKEKEEDEKEEEEDDDDDEEERDVNDAVELVNT